jgi:uncharacterized protein
MKYIKKNNQNKIQIEVSIILVSLYICIGYLFVNHEIIKKSVAKDLCDVSSIHCLLHPKLPFTDKGIWSESYTQIPIIIPNWIQTKELQIALNYQKEVGLLHVDFQPLWIFPLIANHQIPSEVLSYLKTIMNEKVIDALQNKEMEFFKQRRSSVKIFQTLSKKQKRNLTRDQDRDQIPDQIDLYLGLNKVRLNGATYRGGYERIKYPKGDIKRDHGVCTDVVIRMLRNAGWDLQAMVLKDMLRSPKSYGLKKGAKPNKHVDHRRVRRLIVYFKRHFKSLSTQFDKMLHGQNRWLPGDIVFMDTFPNKSGPDHIGVVSDHLSDSNVPLILNNWTDGYHTKDMNLIGYIPITHRFRITLPK